MTLPDQLTIARALSVPVVVVLFEWDFARHDYWATGVFIAAMATHPGARYAGPAWLAGGLVVYGLVRRGRGETLLEKVASPDEQVLP